MTEDRKITTIFSISIDSNMQMMNSPGISPLMDAIQKFKVAKNTGSEFARSASANINMVMKSGTSELHGTIYEFLRNSQFDANEFFFNRNRTPDSSEKLPFNLNQQEQWQTAQGISGRVLRSSYVFERNC